MIPVNGVANMATLTHLCRHQSGWRNFKSSIVRLVIIANEKDDNSTGNILSNKTPLIAFTKNFTVAYSFNVLWATFVPYCRNT
jgi:hypothetical protein